MDGVGAGPPGRVEDEVGAQVGVGGGVAGEPDGDVGLRDVRQPRVGVGVHGDRLDAEAAAGGEDPAGDLAAVGDEQSVDLGHVRNTPKRSVPTTGLLAITDRQMPSTVRVSRGSMTPSSYNIPESA